MQNNHGEKILTLQEVAEYLRLHPSTVSRYAKSGEIKSHLIGRRRLFTLGDVLEFFDNRVAVECVSGKESSNGDSCNPETN